MIFPAINLHAWCHLPSQLSAAIVDPNAKGLKVVEPTLWEAHGHHGMELYCQPWINKHQTAV